MEKVIIIKALPKNRWAKMLRYPNCKRSIAPYLSPKGGVETGLTDELRIRLENELGMAPRELGRTAKFWHNYKIDMTDKDKVLYTDTPEGELAYHFLMGHKDVATSLSAKNDWPDAEFYIENVEEEAKQDNAKAKRKVDAIKKYAEMSIDEMRNVLKVIGKAYAPEATSNEVVEKTVRNYAESKFDEFLTMVNDKHFKAKAFVSDLLRIKALRKNGTHYLYGDTPIGHDLETAILFLEDPVNQSIKLQLKKQLEASSKSGV